MRIRLQPLKILIFIIIGACIQNIMWYLRLQNPYLLREFQIYWNKDGARMFLDFNMINYYFLVLALIIYIIFSFINKRRLESDKEVKEVSK